MAKQIFVKAGARAGASCRDSEAPYLADLADELESALAAGRSITMLAGSAWIGAKATIENGDDSQDAADAIAQGLFDGGMTTSPFVASEIDAAGSISELTNPTPS